MARVHLSLGSNLGSPLENILRAYAHLSGMLDLKLLECSRFYRTPPWGELEQPEFINSVLVVETDLSPHGLLAGIKAVEWNLGRRKTYRYGPRVIDIDIIFYEDVSLSTPALTIPHPHWQERPFVCLPLEDVVPASTALSTPFHDPDK